MDPWTSFLIGVFTGSFAVWLRLRKPSTQIRLRSAQVVDIETARKKRKSG